MLEIGCSTGLITRRARARVPSTSSRSMPSRRGAGCRARARSATTAPRDARQGAVPERLAATATFDTIVLLGGRLLPVRSRPAAHDRTDRPLPGRRRMPRRLPLAASGRRVPAVRRRGSPRAAIGRTRWETPRAARGGGLRARGVLPPSGASRSPTGRDCGERPVDPGSHRRRSGARRGRAAGALPRLARARRSLGSDVPCGVRVVLDACTDGSAGIAAPHPFPVVDADANARRRSASARHPASGLRSRRWGCRRIASGSRTRTPTRSCLRTG